MLGLCLGLVKANSLSLSRSLSLTVSLSSNIYGAQLAPGAKATEVSKPRPSPRGAAEGEGHQELVMVRFIGRGRTSGFEHSVPLFSQLIAVS